MVAATLAMAGLLTFPSLAEAAVAPLVYLMGRRLDINPLAVFLSFAFCTRLWGPVGAFLAVPLLMVATVSTEHAFAEAEPNLPG